MGKKQGEQSRRDFFKLAATVGVGSLAAGLAGPARAQDKAGGEVMPKRDFGRMGVKVPILSLGTMFDTITNQIVLKQALKLGVTYWDTAESYEGGRSEQGIGQFFKKNPGSREQVFLVTKSYSPVRSAEILDTHLKQSLERLQTSHIDLYYVHSVTDIKEVDNKETRDWAAKAKASGKIKWFGFSSHKNMEDLLSQAAKLDYIDGILATYNWRIMGTAKIKDGVAACAEKGIGLTAMKTQGQGPDKSENEGDSALAERFLKQGFTPEQTRLKAVWTEPRVSSVCSQMPNLTQLMANAAAAMDKTKLSSADVQALADYAQATSSCYCAGCSGICEGALGGEVPVADVMRSLMYWRSYGDYELARNVYGQLPAQALAGVSEKDLAWAEKRCPQGLAIARLLREASEGLA
jgi:hypothetical protein